MEWHLQHTISRPIPEERSLPEWMKPDHLNFDPHSRSPPLPHLHLVIPGTESRLLLVSHHVNHSRLRPRPKLANRERAEYPPKPPLLTHYRNQHPLSRLERGKHQQQHPSPTDESLHQQLVNPLHLEQQPNPNSPKHRKGSRSQVEVALENQ